MTVHRIESMDSKQQIQNLENYITEIKNFCRNDIAKVDHPKAKALLETAADVLEGLEKAFSDFQSENKTGWVNDPERPTLQ